MKNLTPAERAELEARGAAIADRIEFCGPDPDKGAAIENLSPELALRYTALRRAIAIREADAETSRAVDRARNAGLSWHKIALPLGMTAEGARRRYAHGNNVGAQNKRRAKPTNHTAPA